MSIQQVEPQADEEKTPLSPIHEFHEIAALMLRAEAALEYGGPGKDVAIQRFLEARSRMNQFYDRHLA
jgi:hypothetical protein